MPQVEVSSAEEWAEACSSAFVPLRVRSASARFDATLQQHVLSPEVSLTRVSSTASEVYRSDRVIAQHPRDDLLVSLHRSGRGTVRQHGRQTDLTAGRAALYDASVPYTLAFTGRMSEIVLQVPRRALPSRRHEVDDLTARTLPDGAALRALTALAASVVPEADDDAGPADLAIADALVTLLGAVVSDSTSGPLPLDGRLLLTALHRYVDEHLADPDLGPEQLAHAHHVSLRLVQKLFAEVGDSPAAHIRGRRLQAARRLLVRGESVARAAYLSGFPDPDTFTRAFKREFGTLPSAVRR